LVDVVMPQMGTSMSEGTVVAWSVEVGEPVVTDQTICEVSTDKIDVECPAPAIGVLAEILVPVGATVDVGTVLARIASDAGTIPAPAPATLRNGDDAASPGAAPAPRGPAGSRRFSPVVQRVAAVHGVDPSLVPGTGRGGRVTKRDLLAWIERRDTGAAGGSERPLHSESPYLPDAPRPTLDDLGGVAEPLSRMRQSIGAAMRRSLDTAATCTTVVECDMSQVERRRRELGLTALPLVARATIDVLREFPLLNATLEGGTLVRYERVHLGIAVSLGDRGLIVPVIHDAQELAPEGLAARVKDLAGRARAMQLEPDEVRGATFTITNPGRFGALIATPVIPLPQVAILDLEAIVKRPIVVDDGHGGDAIAIRPLTHLCMSWDHRALDGAYAARFLTALRQRLEAA
jgi:pyruvate/2-oxoglutarate dehydrogenase complex dihydrolipoamide acyltransferase (E2) component